MSAMRALEIRKFPRNVCLVRLNGIAYQMVPGKRKHVLCARSPLLHRFRQARKKFDRPNLCFNKFRRVVGRTQRFAPVATADAEGRAA